MLPFKPRKNPWKYTLRSIKLRVRDTRKGYDGYLKKGIKCLVSEEELRYLWFRDKAYEMRNPSIDRINPKKHYTIKNCRYIEHVVNSGRHTISREGRSSISEYMKSRWKLPKYRKMQSDKTKKQWLDPEFRKLSTESASKNLARLWKIPSWRKNRAETIKRIRKEKWAKKIL